MFRGKEPELGKVAEKFEKVFCTSKGYKNNEIIYSVWYNINIYYMKWHVYDIIFVTLEFKKDEWMNE